MLHAMPNWIVHSVTSIGRLVYLQLTDAVNSIERSFCFVLLLQEGIVKPVAVVFEGQQRELGAYAFLWLALRC